MKAPLIIAHRTCPPYAPENSVQGVRVAFEQGADGVEVDVRSTLDLRAYLMHDNTMSRTTGWPLPMELTPSALMKQFRLRGGDEPPPRLAQALDELPEGKVVAFDVKTPWSIVSVIQEINHRRLYRRSLIWCSSALVARYARSRLPDVEVAHYKDYEDGPNNLAFIQNAKRLGVKAVSLDWRAIDAAIVEAAHLAGLRVYAWHKDYEITAAKIASGLDGLITDHPAKARAIIDGL